MTRSAVFAAAADEWRQLRDEFELVREAAFEQAHEDCHGVLLNQRGRAAGVDPYSLFMGTTTRAMAYASDELREHWRSHTRPTFAAFERQRWGGAL
ncbi:hypothetical protein [Leifsonia sp. WHRI 6310E]|uniref:hypothetical protein n=1 Tax=Leifsonia sp. WHRI 6310E TaxID=3162562 RepID=UPI0032F04C2F